MNATIVNFIRKLRYAFSQWGTLIVAILIIIIGVESAVLFGANHRGFASLLAAKSSISLQVYADSIVEKCSSVSYRPACYDIEVPKLMDRISMEDAFRVIGAIQQKDGGYWYCHVAGHNLSSREVKKDPSKWKEVVTRCPGSMCSNGCIHGGFQERFRTDVLSDAEVDELLPDFQEVCDLRPHWYPTRLEQATCYHALGHLAMYVTDANIHKATEICRAVATTKDGWNFSQLCLDGAFMQIFQPLEPEDFALVEGKTPSKEQFASFCGKFTGKERGSCWNEGWPLFFEEIKTPSGLVKFCSGLRDDPPQEKRCYDALFYVLTAQFKLDPERVKNFCGGLPQEKIAQCFSDAATRMIETDKHLITRAVELCGSANTFNVHAECYNALVGFSTYNFHRGSQEFFDLCASLPQPWANTCLAKSEG